jgi:hypothetical protein
MALLEAWKTTVWELPGVRVKEDGVAVTPAGTPETVIFTGELNAPTAFAVSVPSRRSEEQFLPDSDSR